MNIVDSSGWLEYFTDGPNAKAFEKIILGPKSKVLVPSIIIYEVFKKVLNEQGEDIALQVIAQLQQYEIVEVGQDIALLAAKLSVQHKLAMADSIIYAIGQHFSATIWTQDDDFKKLSGVKYIKKK